MIIDAKNTIIGRLATIVAKKALLGEKIDIVNCEDAIITGKKDFLIARYQRKKDMGTFKGPYQPKMADRFVRRIIRGMLPYKQEKGKNAYKRVMCYIGVPEELKDKQIGRIDSADISKVKNLDYMNIKDIIKKLK
jgi:large subunit ribosomal protein L13